MNVMFSFFLSLIIVAAQHTVDPSHAVVSMHPTGREATYTKLGYPTCLQEVGDSPIGLPAAPEVDLNQWPNDKQVAYYPPAVTNLPTFYATCGNILSAQPTIAAVGVLNFGTAPFTFRLYRSPNCNLNTDSDNPAVANDPAATVIDTQTKLPGRILPSPFTDTSAPVGMNFYTWVVEDSSPVPKVAVSRDIAVVTAATLPSVQVLAVGDSIGVGHQAKAYIQQIVSFIVGSGGANYTYATAYIPPPPGPNGIQATAACHITNGQIDYIYCTNPGWGYNVETPLTVTILGDGVGATAVANPGGGPSLACQQILQQLYNYDTVSILNCSVGGSAASGWLPYSTSKRHWNDAAKATCLNPLSVPTIVTIRLGPNDANGLTTPAAYLANMTALAKDFLAWGAKTIVIDPPLWWGGSSDLQRQYLLQQYGRACLQLAQSNPSQIICTGSQNYPFFYAHPEHLNADNLHPDDSGYAILGAIMAKTLIPLLNIAPKE